MPAALQSGVSPHLVLSRSTAVGPVGGPPGGLKLLQSWEVCLLCLV